MSRITYDDLTSGMLDDQRSLPEPEPYKAPQELPPPELYVAPHNLYGDVPHPERYPKGVHYNQYGELEYADDTPWTEMNTHPLPQDLNAFKALARTSVMYPTIMGIQALSKAYEIAKGMYHSMPAYQDTMGINNGLYKISSSGEVIVPDREKFDANAENVMNQSSTKMHSPLGLADMALTGLDPTGTYMGAKGAIESGIQDIRNSRPGHPNVGGVAVDALALLGAGLGAHELMGGGEALGIRQPKLPGMQGVDFAAKIPEPVYERPIVPVDTPQMVKARAFAAIDGEFDRKTLELKILQSQASSIGDHAKATALDNDILQAKIDMLAAKRNWQPPILPPEAPAPVFPDITGEQPNLAMNLGPNRVGGKFAPEPAVPPEYGGGTLGPPVGTLPTPEPLASPVQSVSGITPQMRADLTELGLADEAINKMTPQQAQEFIGVVREPAGAAEIQPTEPTTTPVQGTGSAFENAMRASIDAQQKPEVLSTKGFTSQKLKEALDSGYQIVKGLRDTDGTPLLLRSDLNPTEYMRRQASRGAVLKGAKTTPPRTDEGMVDIRDFQEIFFRLKEMFGRDPTNEEVNQAVNRQPGTGEITGRVAGFPAAGSVERSIIDARRERPQDRADIEAANTPQQLAELFGHWADRKAQLEQLNMPDDVRHAHEMMSRVATKYLDLTQPPPSPAPTPSLPTKPGFPSFEPQPQPPQQGLPFGPAALRERSQLENISNAPRNENVDFGPQPKQESFLKRLYKEDEGTIDSSIFDTREWARRIREILRSQPGTFDERLTVIADRMRDNVVSSGILRSDNTSVAEIRNATPAQLPEIVQYWNDRLGTEQENSPNSNHSEYLSALAELAQSRLDEIHRANPRAPSLEFMQRLGTANYAEADRMHQEAYQNHGLAYNESGRIRLHEPNNSQGYEDAVNAMHRHQAEMQAASERITRVNATHVPDYTEPDRNIMNSFREPTAWEREAENEWIPEPERILPPRQDLPPTPEQGGIHVNPHTVSQMNSMPVLQALADQWVEERRTALREGNEDNLHNANLIIDAIDRRLEELNNAPPTPIRGRIVDPHSTLIPEIRDRLVNASSISDVTNYIEELQQQYPDQIHSGTGRQILTAANARILELGGTDYDFIPEPRNRRYVASSGLISQWEPPKKSHESLPEQGPLPREPLLPFDEPLDPQVPKWEVDTSPPTLKELWKEGQRNLPIKPGITEDQYARLTANVPPSSVANRKVSQFSGYTQFGTDIALSGGSGPPGLRVERLSRYSDDMRIVYRDAKGQPLVTAKLSTASDGGLGISSLGKVEPEHTLGTREVNEGVGLVLEHAAKIGAAIPTGSFSDFTATLIRNAKRRVVPNDAGFIEIGDIIDAVKEAGYKLKDVASELFNTDETGAVGEGGPSKGWQRIREKTGIGGTPKPEEPIKDPIVVNGRIVSREAVGKAGTSWIDEALGLAKTATTYADFSAMKQTTSQFLTPEYWGGVKRMIQAGLSPEWDRAIHEEILKKDMFQHEEGPNGEELPSWAQRVGFKLIGSGDMSTRSEMIGSNWLENGRFFGVPDNPASRFFAWSLGRVVRSSTRAFRTQMNYVAANRLEFLADRMADIAATGALTGETSRPGILGGANLSDIRLPGFDLSKLRGTSKDIGFGMKQKVTLEQAMEMNPYHNIVLGRHLSDFVRTATGQAPLKMHWLPGRGWESNLESAAKPLTRVLFAPRNLFTKFRMLNPSTYAMAPPFVRKQYLKAALASTAAWFAVTKMTQIAGQAMPQLGVKVSWDPENADFGKIRIGNTRIDFGQGYLPFLTMWYRWVSGHYVSSSSGLRHQYGEGFNAQTQLGQTGRTLVGNKLEPFIAFITDLMGATEQQPFHVVDRSLQLAIPMAAQDMWDMAHSQPWMLPFSAVPILAGAASQTYGRKAQPRFIPSKYDLVIKHPSLGMGLIK